MGKSSAEADRCGTGSFTFGLNTVIYREDQTVSKKTGETSQKTPEKIESAEQSRAESSQAKEVKYPLTKELFFYYNRKGKKHKQKMMTETVRCFRKA